MISQVLRKARMYEEDSDKIIRKEDRPGFHLTPRIGWMNDPNGFSLYDGKYHMFYQYHPYSTEWGPMHWGHAVSEDMLHWEYLPVAIAPDEEYDKEGCFSGSAITLPDGRHLLMYTGVSQEKGNDAKNNIQAQCIAVGDGIFYEKYENNPVLDEKDLPEGASRYDFRDPKLMRLADGTYACVVGNRPADGSGQILLFTSEDAFSWKFERVLIANENRFGKMWECPDFFPIEDNWVLIVSPQDMLPQGTEYFNGNGTLCIIGEFDEQNKTFVEKQMHTIDYGTDFYAPQTTLTPDGRRIMIGWMQNWDTCCVRMPEQKWFGQMSLPRELSIQNGRLYQKPVRELLQLRRNKVSYDAVKVSGVVSLDGIKGRRIDMELEIEAEKEQELYDKFEIRVAQNETFYTSVSFAPKESVLTIDRSMTECRRATLHQRSCKVNSENGKLKLRVILDSYSMEVFVNDGEQVMTTTFYTEQSADGILFMADGNVTMNIEKYDLIME